MKTRVFNLVIIDESGSMHSIKKEAIDSVNETIQSVRSAQKNDEEQEYFVSLVTFNNNVKTVCDCVRADEVCELTEKTYNPSCCTALYDAMGVSINELRKKVAESDRVLVTVVTDGYENASREYSGKAIKALVDELKEKGWVFAYIGANQDVEAVAAAMSITNAMSFEATIDGTIAMSKKLETARNRLFSAFKSECYCAEDANTNFFKDLDF